VTTYEVFVSYDIGANTRSVMIEENDSFNHVLNDLKAEEIVRGPFLFKSIAVLFDIDKSLAPGRYDFSGRISMYDVLRKLEHHDIAMVMITIPEGQTVRKTAGVFARELGVDSSAFVNLAFDTSFIMQKYGIENLEGYLFPETYRMWYGIQNDQIMDILFGQFENQTKKLFDSLPAGSYTTKEILTLASIIEAEAMDGDEKALISSVYHNRLDKRMRLQADPTVIYALNGLDRPLNYRDLEYESPYNTYKHRGLPPGPINSPGQDAIKAAIYPENSEYLYFVADGTGRHIFSRTLQEHNRAKRQVKRKLRENKSN